jgi:S-adenosylmethionine decarboxylase
MEHFGEHLMIDGYGGSLDALSSGQKVLAYLKTLPEQLGMQVIAEPQIVHFPGNDKKDPGGWTGITLIAESHISIHTFPKRGFLTADVYSCKNGMDTEAITDFLKKTFELKEVEMNFVKRGTRYPENNIY